MKQAKYFRGRRDTFRNRNFTKNNSHRRQHAFILFLKEIKKEKV